MHKIAWIVITDGRPKYLSETMKSAREKVKDNFFAKIMINDSGDSLYDTYLKDTYPDFTIVSHQHRRGYSGAIRSAWNSCPVGTEYIFHLEEDFVFMKDFDTQVLADALESHPYLVQLCLVRQPVNPQEEEVGGFIFQRPDSYEDKEQWMEHRNWFSANPCVYNVRWTKFGWPENGTEGDFTAVLNQDPNIKYGYWGKRTDPPYVWHIGHLRTKDWIW